MAHGTARRTAGDHHVGGAILGPGYEIWLEAVRRVRPDLYTAFNPWDRITTPEAVHQLLHDGGAQRVEVTAGKDGYQALRTPELTFRTLVHTSEAILEGPPVERGGGVTSRLCHVLYPLQLHCFLLNHNFP